MKIKNLIQKLQKYNPESEIVVSDKYNYSGINLRTCDVELNNVNYPVFKETNLIEIKIKEDSNKEYCYCI
jgi:hypothetical protein